jgi:SAM-dependent methyltransferase
VPETSDQSLASHQPFSILFDGGAFYRKSHMLPKPSHLGPQYGEQFKDKSVVAAYRYRPDYPAETFNIIERLLPSGERAVLDIGCGPGNIARHLIEHVDRIDAVDLSAEMIALAKRLPNGDHPAIHWINASVEEASLDPPYSLITAGASLHWMAWEVVFPRFVESLAPNSYLALIGNPNAPVPWWNDLVEIISRYSTNREYQRYSLVDELQKRSLFRVHGEARTTPVTFTQSLDDYIESFHARNGFSRDRLTPEAAMAFDKEARALVSTYCPDEHVHLEITGHVIWGRPSFPFYLLSAAKNRPNSNIRPRGQVG